MKSPRIWARHLCLWLAVSPPLASAADGLFDAVRAGDSERVVRFIDAGADINRRDETGTTALMYATIYADDQMLQLLLSRGADVNARNEANATALMWAVSSPTKAKLLIEHGARVDVSTDAGLTPLIMAAVLPGSLETVKLLLQHGADINANSKRFSPLMAASFLGDDEVVKLLVDHGAEVTARNQFGFSPLHGAAVNGNTNTTRLMLSQGVDPNVDVQGFTPAMWAAVHGKTEALALLVGAGADVNARQADFATTPLLWASTTRHLKTIELLLEHGADVDARDKLGNTPLTWAKRRNDARIVAMFKAAGGVDPSPALKTTPTRKKSKPVTDGRLRVAIGKSLGLLQRTGRAFIANGEGCVSCHHQSVPAMAIGLARRRGFEFNEEVAKAERQAVLDQLEEQREDLLQGFGAIDVLDPAYFLAGLAAEGQKRNRTIDAAVAYLIGRQQQDGRWKNFQHRPPMQQSDIVNTAFGIRSLKVYGLPGRSEEMKDRIDRARTWLEDNNTPSAADSALRLLGLGWSDAKLPVLKQASDELIATQSADGGWSQLPTMQSDSYATGIVLVALHEAGGLATNSPIYQRGLQFLVDAQLADGSWFVQTRSFPVQEYFETSFPHERSQFISTAATAWSTMAILHALPGKQRQRKPTQIRCGSH